MRAGGILQTAIPARLCNIPVDTRPWWLLQENKQEVAEGDFWRSRAQVHAENLKVWSGFSLSLSNKIMDK